MSDALALRLAPDVRAAAYGDQQAFARLVDATRTIVTSITLAILRDIELSRDVAQDVYLMVWRDLGKLREPASFLPWLRQLTRNRAHQALRTHVREKRRFEPAADEMLAAAADPRPDAIARIVAAEDRAALASAIAALPSSAREVVVLYYREGRSAAQVAALLDLSEDAVKQRLSRTRQRLRDALVKQIEDSTPGATFTAAVVAGIASLAAPAAASAAMIGAGKAAKLGAFGAGHAGKLGIAGLTGAAAFSALAGLAGGWGGQFFGTRALLRLARDDDERRGVLAAGLVGMLATLVFVASILIRPTPLVATIGFAAIMLCFAITHFIWLPRVTRRRIAAELREDPVGAALLHRKRRLQGRIGLALGLLLGGAAVLASWFF